jgi:hypothetical protein
VWFYGRGTAIHEHYKLSAKVVINAIADVDYLVNELSLLIENPNEIIAINVPEHL